MVDDNDMEGGLVEKLNGDVWSIMSLVQAEVIPRLVGIDKAGLNRTADLIQGLLSPSNTLVFEIATRGT